MIRTTRLAATFAFVAALAAGGAALAQAQTGSAAPAAAAATAQSVLAPAQPASPWAPPDTLTIQHRDADASQPTYSVNPPPDGGAGVYLPAAVLGYAKSAAGCVVIGCDDGPQVGGASGASSGPAEPPAANPGPADRR